MQINKSKKPSSRQSSNTIFDSDFASGFEDSKFDRFKPLVRILAIVIIVVGIACTYFLFFHRSNDTEGLNDIYTPSSSQTNTDNGAAQNAPEAAETTQDPEQDTAPSSGNTQPQGSSSDGNSTPTTKPYDPSKCEPLNNEAARLRQLADQKKTTYDNAFAARRSFGEIYSEVRSKYGNDSSMHQIVAAETDRIVKAENERLNLLQTDWEDALNKGNVAYGEYQECRASL